MTLTSTTAQYERRGSNDSIGDRPCGILSVSDLEEIFFDLRRFMQSSTEYGNASMNERMKISMAEKVSRVRGFREKVKCQSHYNQWRGGGSPTLSDKQSPLCTRKRTADKFARGLAEISQEAPEWESLGAECEQSDPNISVTSAVDIAHHVFFSIKLTFFFSSWTRKSFSG